MHIIVGLGNPGVEYEKTRHNTGKWLAGLVEEKELDGVKVLHLDSFMNKSGLALAKFVKSKKTVEKLVVIYDDLDLPLGSFKISYNRGSGGHKGVESIIKALKTREFIRIRVGVSPTTPSGKLKKPKGEKEVEKFILGEFKKPEFEGLKKVSQKVLESIKTLEAEGLNVAMTLFN